MNFFMVYFTTLTASTTAYSAEWQEQCTEKYVEGSGHGLSEVLPPHVPEELRKTTEKLVTTAGDLAEIQTNTA
jgi:hypothetical protein